MISRLRRMWNETPSAGALELVLPDGERMLLGIGAGRLARGSGVGAAEAIEGPPPSIRVHDERLFLRLALRGEMGAGESFVAGEWSCDDLPGAIRRFLRVSGARGFESPLTFVGQLPSLWRHRKAANSIAGSERNIHAHYDLGNAFYRLFLDAETMAYSCGIWEHGDRAVLPASPSALEAALAAAQLAKLERLCDQLALSPADHLLEIGCGWGGMAIHAAKTRGCKVTAITVSREQHELARARVAAEGLAERVEIQYRDYRTLGDGGGGAGFDKLVSIEMLEAVGYEYLPSYFAVCGRALRPGGVMALQSITMPDDRFESYRKRVDWMQTYIFPGSLIPSVGAIRRALPGTGLVLDETASLDIGPSYAATLRAWTRRFTEALPTVRTLGFDAPFQRTWLMYLAFSEAAFAERTLGDHQLVLRKI